MKYYLRLETHNPAYPGYYFWTTGGWSKDHPALFFADTAKALNKLAIEKRRIVDHSWEASIKKWDGSGETYPSDNAPDGPRFADENDDDYDDDEDNRIEYSDEEIV